MVKQGVRHDLCLEILHNINDKIEEHPSKLSSFFLSVGEKRNP